MLTKYFDLWRQLPGSNQVSKKQIAIYAEALIDLSLEALEYGCKEATKTAERFPWPGHIRKAAEGYQTPDDRSGMLSARGLEWNPQLEQERLERMRIFKKLLENGNGKPERVKLERVKPEPEKPPIGATRHNKSLEQQKQDLREKGWLQ